ncbi:glycosyltransferase [Conexibacter sp. DBS9H8]|uniref:glycosyltransferase n=1 Tax=Conexibacter sp. DBS9H8 TaxID=2937801 RepID=UPI00200C9ACA|nr:glycosyltransferase [Conexibacter sp. DBS9H8]
MRICLVYDCLFPYTVGGAERWYRNLALRLVADGHQVTYLTLCQWAPGTVVDLPGVDVRCVGPRCRLYTRGGRRRMLPPLLFGLGVLSHLLRHGRRYDAVHTASFPYFSLIAAGLLRPWKGYRLVVDWFEVWSLAYWRSYIGALAGTVGWLIQGACARFSQRAFCFSRLHASRLGRLATRGATTVLRGAYDGPTDPARALGVDPVVVFAGRLIPEKQAAAVVSAVAAARGRVPGLRAEIYGDGPDREAVVQAVRALGLGDVISVCGFVPDAAVEAALTRAMCLLLPSRREGYGLVVVEAAARGTPSLVVAGADNAAVELISDGENGLVADSIDPDELAERLERIWILGDGLRDRTRAWFDAHADELALTGSLERVVGSYAGADSARVYEASVPAAVAAQLN